MQIETHTEHGAEILIEADGTRRRMERTVTTVNDWRETAFGPVNFGYTILGPERWIAELEGKR